MITIYFLAFLTFYDPKQEMENPNFKGPERPNGNVSLFYAHSGPYKNLGDCEKDGEKQSVEKSFGKPYCISVSAFKVKDKAP
ncbi:hypothetical protein [Acetobacter ascendens]|uniref:hypothetical protein n=1 Tax=Acetobacter ascendens TaxID=481146 RepID=UPI000875E5C5|nr:hypothetical protein [Acetobacter ascendens]AOW48416.1 hypothetical protein A4R89_02185 [Acetobacter ascendens]